MTIAQCFVAAFLTVALTAKADVPQTGLYRIADDENDRRVQRTDAGADAEIRLGALLSANLSQASLRSVANDNSLYGLSLTAGPIPEGADVGRLAIVVAGRCMATASDHGRRKDGFIDVRCMVEGEEAAKEIAKALGVEPKLRKHPGHRLLTTVKPKQPSYRPGEAVTLVMTIRNVGDTSVAFSDGGQQRGPRNNQFSFVAFSNFGGGRALPDTGDALNFGGMAAPISLAPGEVFTKEVLLTNWFTFSKPDSYEITATYQIGLRSENDRVRPIWDDFATARCMVRVTAPEAAKETPATERSKHQSREAGAPVKVLIPKSEGTLNGPFVTAESDRFGVLAERDGVVIIEFYDAPAEAGWFSDFELLYCQKQHDETTIKVIRKATEEERRRFRIPLWIQDKEIPECCGQPMHFVGQIDDDTLCTEPPPGARYWWHDAASFYVFTCSKCLECKAVGQQY